MQSFGKATTLSHWGREIVSYPHLLEQKRNWLWLSCFSLGEICSSSLTSSAHQFHDQHKETGWWKPKHKEQAQGKGSPSRDLPCEFKLTFNRLVGPQITNYSTKCFKLKWCKTKTFLSISSLQHSEWHIQIKFCFLFLSPHLRLFLSTHY